MWKQRSELLIDGKIYKSQVIDINFKVPFDSADEPNVSETSIFNVTEDTIARFKKGRRIILNAGYEGDMGTILAGVISGYEVLKNGTDVELVAYVAPSIDQWTKGTVSRTFKSGTTNRQAINELVRAFGLRLGKLELAKQITYSRPKTVAGSLKDALSRLARESGSKFYIKNDQIFILKKDAGMETGFLLTPNTGLIGSPKRAEVDEKDGWQVESLLNHRINVDSLIRVRSQFVSGDFRVVEGEHTNGSTIMEVVER